MKVIGSILIILALVTAVVPQFTDCQSQGRALTLDNGKSVPMKCHWTAEATLGISGPLFLVGVLSVVSKRKETLRALGVVGLGMGAVLVLLPTALIGVCSMPEMICNSVMKPTLILTGTLTMGLGLVMLALNWKAEAPMVSSGQVA